MPRTKSATETLRLRIVALPRARKQPRLVDADFDLVILVRPLAFCRLERKLVPRVGIRERLLQKSRRIVARVQNQAPALRGDHLQRKVAGRHLIRLADPLQKLLVVEGAQRVFPRANRIDVVQGDARLTKLGGRFHDRPKETLLLL